MGWYGEVCGGGGGGGEGEVRMCEMSWMVVPAGRVGGRWGGERGGDGETGDWGVGGEELVDGGEGVSEKWAG